MFDEINQKLKMSLLKFIHKGGVFPTRFKFEHVLLVRICNVFERA